MLAESVRTFDSHFDPKVAGGAALAHLANILRQTGIRRTTDLGREAVANPELARAVLKVPTSADAGPPQIVARVLRRGLIGGPMVAGQQAGARWRRAPSGIGPPS